MSFLAFLQGLVDTIVVSLRGVGQGITNFLPELLGAVVIVIVGWIVGALVGRLVAHIIKAIKLDSLLENAGFGNVVKRAGFNLNSGRFVGGLVEWFIIVAFLVAAFDVLGLTQVNVFLQSVVLLYLPQVIVAVLILL